MLDLVCATQDHGVDLRPKGMEEATGSVSGRHPAQKLQFRPHNGARLAFALAMKTLVPLELFAVEDALRQDHGVDLRPGGMREETTGYGKR